VYIHIHKGLRYTCKIITQRYTQVDKALNKNSFFWRELTKPKGQWRAFFSSCIDGLVQILKRQLFSPFIEPIQYKADFLEYLPVGSAYYSFRVVNCACNVFACVCVYVCARVHVYIYIHIHTYENIHTCTHLSVRICKYVCIHNMHIYIHTYTYICIWICAYMFTHGTLSSFDDASDTLDTFMYVYMYICIYVYMYICIYVYIYMYIHMHVHLHV